MMRAFLQRRASSVSAGLRPAARRGVASATKTTTTALRLQQQHPQHQQQQRRRLLLATGATIFTLTAYTTLVERPAKV